ncbi:Ribosomal-protein N-acetyltransferase [Abortiporus biennis]
MSFVNNYKPPELPTVLPESELYGPTPYDLNFVFPVHPESLHTERVQLTPFIPAIHGKAYWEVAQDPYHFRYYPFICDTYEKSLSFFERSRRDPNYLMFAIIDKTKPVDPKYPEIEGGRLAGVIGYFNTVAGNLSTEIGHVFIFPEFQKTHVSSNAVGILLQYGFALPTASPPGLGLRRIFWSAHTGNEPSANLARRMGLKDEGVFRWHWVLPDELKGYGKPCDREGDPFPGRTGRDTRVLAIGWDDWQNGWSEKVQAIIDRKA